MIIQVDDLRGSEIAKLLTEHLDDMAAVSPPESRHALDLHALRQRGVTFWSAWEGPELVGCGALKELDRSHAEIKSMRTAPAHRGKGIGARILEHLIAEAKRRRYTRLSLETGAMPFFTPAHRLYRKFGFTACDPFGSYVADSNSVFMTKQLEVELNACSTIQTPVP